MMRFVLVMFLLPACAPKTGSASPPDESPLHLQAVPDFESATLTGAQLDTKALRDTVVVVKFFALYCRPCRRTLPAAQEIHARYGDDVAFVGVSEDEEVADAREVVARFGLTFPVVHDADKALARRFQVTGLPSTFVIDRDGIVQWVGRDARDEAGLELAIAAATGETGGP